MPGRGRRGARLLRGGGLPGHTPGGAATRRRAAYTGRGAGYPAGYVRGATGRTSGAATRGGRIPGGGATGQNRRLFGAHVGGYRGAGYPVGYPGGVGYLCRGGYRAGLYRGAGYPAGRRGGTPSPGSGYPRRATRAQLVIWAAARDGYTPS